MTKEQMSIIISGTDPKYVEEAKNACRLYSRKKLITIGLVATLSLCLVGAAAAILEKPWEAVSHDYNPETEMFSNSTFVGGDFAFGKDIYTVEWGKTYFIYEGRKEDITEFCSATTYFAYEEVDEEGNGFVIVVGGDSKKNRGYFKYIFTNGLSLNGIGSYPMGEDWTADDYRPIWIENADKIYGQSYFQ